jgi:predicted dienelactone hydrolase
MLVSGTADETTPIDPETERPWELIPGRPRYRVDIADAGHQSFTDICLYQDVLADLPDAAPAIVEAVDEFAVEGCADELIDIDEAHQLIDLYTVSFLLVEVAGDDGPAVVLTPEFAETQPAVTFEAKE